MLDGRTETQQLVVSENRLRKKGRGQLLYREQLQGNFVEHVSDIMPTAYKTA